MTQPVERVVPVRPLLYTRLRLFLGGQAEMLGAVLNAALDESYVELDRLRAEHAPEADIEAVKDEIIHLVNARRDIQTGLLDQGLEFLKVRVYRGGQADTLRDVLLGEQERLLEQLGAMRAAGRTEDDEDVEQVRQQLHWLNGVMKDLNAAQVDLVGPDRDPR